MNTIFKNKEEFSIYVDKVIRNFNINQYKINDYGAFREYSVKDKNNEKIILKVISPMKYTIIIE